MLAGRKPGGQTRLGAGQIHTGHTNLGESQRLGPAAQLRQQPRAVEPSMTLLAHPPILETRTFHWPDEVACVAFALRLAALPALRQDTFIALAGPLGAGKTTFVRHLLRALGVKGRIKSPTYAVLEPYEFDGHAVSHFDFYRFNDPREWLDAGFRDQFAAPGLKLAEWPDNAAPLLPLPDWRMQIEPLEDDQRRVIVHAYTAQGLQLLAALPE
jgi:tRNA threonylcarbamoyladenosine biosynthesis protein TsaE